MRPGYYTEKLIARLTGSLVGLRYNQNVLGFSPSCFSKELQVLQTNIRRTMVALAVLCRRPGTPQPLITVARAAAKGAAQSVQPSAMEAGGRAAGLRFPYNSKYGN